LGSSVVSGIVNAQAGINMAAAGLNLTRVGFRVAAAQLPLRVLDERGTGGHGGVTRRTRRFHCYR